MLGEIIGNIVGSLYEFESGKTKDFMLSRRIADRLMTVL